MNAIIAVLLEKQNSRIFFAESVFAIEKGNLEMEPRVRQSDADAARGSSGNKMIARRDRRNARKNNSGLPFKSAPSSAPAFLVPSGATSQKQRPGGRSSQDSAKRAKTTPTRVSAKSAPSSGPAFLMPPKSSPPKSPPPMRQRQLCQDDSTPCAEHASTASTEPTPPTPQSHSLFWDQGATTNPPATIPVSLCMQVHAPLLQPTSSGYQKK